MIVSLGKVTVTTAGTPVRATSTQSVPGTQISCQSIAFQALSSNTGKIYIGTSSSMSKSTYAGVVAVLAVPATNIIPGYNASQLSVAGLNVADFFLDSDNNGEGVIVSYAVA